MHPQPYYITTPIYYVNDRPHIGHCYTTTVADVAARMHRLLGRDVYFLTGTDEHADKVVAAAHEHQMTPQQWADRCSGEFRRAFERLELSPDVFYRTSDPHHKRLAGEYIGALKERGDIYLGDYVGWYDVSQDEYLTETVAKEAEYKSPVTGKPLEKRTEKNYFFRLSKYAEALQKRIEANPGFILPEARRNEVLGRLRGGLQDVPVSRAIRAGDADWGEWGVRMPGDPEHRVYVWIEALCNYLSAVDRDDPGAGAGLRGDAAGHADRGDLRRYWPASVHVMAKDILWFHAVVWPAMLMALGRGLPGTVYAHAYYVRDGRKMSKSLGNFIEIDLLEKYCERYSPDAVRWYLATQGPLGATDADFSHAHFVETFNADLANGIGNCASRVGNMVAKYFDGRVPEAGGRFAFDARSEQQTHASFNWAELTPVILSTYESAMHGFALSEALRVAMRYASDVDQFINATRPFGLAKGIEKGTSADPEGDRATLAAVLYCCAEAVRIASLMLFPACPSKMAALWRTWGCSVLNDPHDIDSGFVAPLAELAKWAGPYGLKAGQAVSKGGILFMRADPAEEPPK
ncbi:MAG: methionine--tRNA ligase [Phycisphaerales bacterium]